MIPWRKFESSWPRNRTARYQLHAAQCRTGYLVILCLNLSSLSPKLQRNKNWQHRVIMSESSDPAPKYRIRPGTFFDVPATTRIYAASFGNEPLIDFFFPTRRQDPLSFYTWSCWRFQRRYWTPGYSLTVVADKHDHPVGLSWWKRPTQPLTLIQKLLSPCKFV